MEVTVRVSGIDKALASFDSKVVTKAAEKSLNEAVRAGRTAASREIRARWNIKAAKVNAELENVKFARQSDLSAVIQAKGRPISLTYFGAKEVRNVGGRVLVQTRDSGKMVNRSRAQRGVTVQVLRGQKTHLSRAFIATTKSGYIGVFERNREGRRNKQGREVIVNKSTITIASMFQQAQVRIATIQAVLTRWESRFYHHLQRLQK